MSGGAAVQKQVLLIMDGLVTSIVAEICQLDIFQSERRNGNLDTDIKMVSSFKCIMINFLTLVNVLTILLSLKMTAVIIVTVKIYNS